jgi:endonuclease VIII
VVLAPSPTIPSDEELPLVPEGHTIHRLARHHKAVFAGRPVRVSSPQGRFADGAAILDGRVLEATDAYGKHLFHGFDGDRWLHIHLGLYGRFSEGPLPAPRPWGALRLRLEGDDTYADLRGPTQCELVTPAEKAGIAARLGPDPLRRGADGDRAWARIARSRVAIGALLMDQSVLAGIGNVYRAEVLYRAGVNPYRVGRDVGSVTWSVMWDDLRTLMRDGLRRGLIITTLPEDRGSRGRVRAEDAHYVYRRAGSPCRRCGTEIRTAVMVARNLFWCPVCQAV